jgi:methyl-accepting chemotaxis protein
MNPRRAALALMCVALIGPAGCIAPRVHNNVPQFADAVTLATENSKGAFQVVDQKYMEVEADALVVNYEQTGFDPRKVKHLLTPDELQIRISLLNALQQYAKTLSEVSSDSKLQEFDDQTKAFGKNLQGLASTDAFKKLLQNSRTPVDIATTAIDALGRWFIERKRKRELPQLIEAMQDPVKRTAELLEADIGNRPDDHGNGGNGLRAQLWNEYMQAMIQQSAFIDHNKDRLDPVAKAREIRKLPELVDERAKADDALRQTSDSMAKLVQAHNELLRAVQTKADLHADISALISEGERIKTFYESLQK